jgi:hypothetical protein
VLPDDTLTVAVALPPADTGVGAGTEINTWGTVTVDVAFPAAYTPSPGYDAVRVLAPLLKVPAGRVNVTVPPESGCHTEYASVARFTIPEGVAPPAAPLTVTGTANGCQATGLVEAGLTATADAVEPGAVTVTTTAVELTCKLFASPP